MVQVMDSRQRSSGIVFFNKKAIRAGAFIHLIALALHLIGMATPHWVDSDKHSAGIWQICSKYFAKAVCVSKVSGTTVEGWLRAVQVLSAIGLMLSAVTVVSIIAYMKKPSYLSLFISGTIALFSGFFVLTGVIVFGSKIYTSTTIPFNRLSWSFGLEASGGCLLLLSGTVILATVITAE